MDEKKISEELNSLFDEVDIKEEILTFMESTKCSKNNLLSKIKNKIDSLNPNKSENIENIQKNLIVENLKRVYIR